MTCKTLYVSDLDGTLLNSTSKLSDTTVEILNRLILQHGIHFTIATARTPATVTHIMERITPQLPYIVMAGAAFWNNQERQYEETRYIPNSVVTSLLKVYEHHHIHPFIYRQHGNCIYAHHIQEMTTDEKLFIDHRLTSPLKQLFSCDVLSAEDQDGAMLIFSMGKYEDLRIIADEIDDQHINCTFMCYHDIFDNEQGYLEIYASQTTKAAAIRHLAKQIGAQRIVVFGDNLNDIPMMAEATHSIAVNNAFEEVKQQADEIIGSNEEDAVAKWIEQDCLSHNTL